MNVKGRIKSSYEVTMYHVTSTLIDFHGRISYVNWLKTEICLCVRDINIQTGKISELNVVIDLTLNRELLEHFLGS